MKTAEKPDKPRARSYALVIGIEDYKDINLGQAHFAERDAKEVYKILTEAPIGKLSRENVELLPSKDTEVTNLGRAITRLFRRVTPLDTVFLYFSGHGKSADTGGYLLPRNFEDTEDVDMDTEAYSFSSLNRHLRVRRPRNFFFLFDCCFSGKALEQIDLNYDLYYRGGKSQQFGSQKDYVKQCENDREEEQQCRMVFCSCLADEEAAGISNFGHGIFTNFLIEGLKGEADHNCDGCVDVDELVTYVKANMSDYNKEHNIYQHPGLYQRITGKFFLPSWGQTSPTGAVEVYDCPICGRRNGKRETFHCKRCNRDHLCLIHQIKELWICEECAKEGKVKNARKAKKAKTEISMVSLGTLPGVEKSSKCTDPPMPGELIWEFQTTDAIFSSPCIDSGRIYIGNRDGGFYCLNAATGSKIWEIKIGAVNSPPCGSNNVVFVPQYDKMAAIDAQNGRIMWEFSLDWGYLNYDTPCYSNGKLFIGDRKGGVCCLRSDTGEVEWRVKLTKEGSWGSDEVLLACAESYVYATCRNSVYCLDIRAGRIMYENTSSPHRISSVPCFNNKMLFLLRTGAYNDALNLLCLDGKTLLNERELYIPNSSVAGVLEFFPSPCVSFSRIYVTAVRSIYCYDILTDNEIFLWRQEAGEFIQCSPCLAGGCIYVGSNDKRIYCFDAETGAKLWDYKTGGSVVSSPCVSNGMLYVGSADGKVYCFWTGNFKVGAWEMFGGGPEHGGYNRNEMRA